MNKRFFFLTVFLALALTALASARTNETALAQGGCTDAAGRPIPCPGGGGDNKKTPTPVPPTVTPTATVTTIPTSTSLPISNPADDGVTEVKWSGTCAGVNKNTTCTDKLITACDKAGGTPDASFDDEADTTTITCTLPAVLEPTPLPLGIPTDDGSSASGSGYTGTCDSNQEKFLSCIMDFVDECIKNGGSSSVSGSDGSITTLKCTTAVVAEPTPLPIAGADDDHWIGRCTEEDAVNGSLEDCFARFTCDEGTLVVKVDLYSGDGTVYDFYCIPHKPTFPPGGWLPWIAGLGGLLIGMLLPSVQKVRAKPEEAQEAQASGTGGGAGKATFRDFSATQNEPQAAVAIPSFMKNVRRAKSAEAATDDAPEEESMQLRAKRAEIPQTREHVLLSNQPDEPPEAGPPLSVAHGGTGVTTAKKPSHLPPPPPLPSGGGHSSGALKTFAAAQPDYNEPPVEEDGMQLRAKRTEATATEGSSGTGSGSGPKPKPTPTPTPPPSPRPIAGDVDGDGDVDGRDF